mgnify:CR=1 FL=1
MNSKYKRLIGDMKIFAIGTLGSKLVLFILLPIYTNVLTEAEYGIADLVFSIGELVLPIISIAIFNGLLRYGIIEGKRESSLLNASIIFIIGSVVTILITPLIALYKPIEPWKWFLSVSVIISFARSNTLAYLKVKDKNKLYSVLSIVQALLLVAFNILFLIIFGWGIKGYLLSTMLSNALLAISSFLLGGMGTDLRSAKFDKSLMREMVIYSIPFIINDISWWIIYSSDKIMIECLIGSTMLGLYTAASKIPSLVNVVTSIFAQAWGLASAKEFDTTNDDNFYSIVFQYFTDAIFGVTILIICFIQPFMRIYVGNAFFAAWHYVPLLLVAAAFAAISTFAVGLYGASKKSKNIMTTSFIAGIINIVVNYLLIQVVDVWGAVIGTVVAYLVLAFLRIIGVKKVIKIRFNYIKLSALSLLCLIQATLVGIEFHAIIISAVSVVVFLILIFKDSKQIIAYIKRMKRK